MLAIDKPSLPSRERGLKFPLISKYMREMQVAPLAGAWIEILSACISIAGFLSLPSRERGLKLCVAPDQMLNLASLPSRERGLKSGYVQCNDPCREVAPLAGAWIEITIEMRPLGTDKRRSPRGSVD